VNAVLSGYDALVEAELRGAIEALGGTVSKTWRVFGTTKTTHLVCDTVTSDYTLVAGLNGLIISKVCVDWNHWYLGLELTCCDGGSDGCLSAVSAKLVWLKRRMALPALLWPTRTMRSPRARFSSSSTMCLQVCCFAVVFCCWSR
jgi:hypothetical protein